MLSPNCGTSWDKPSWKYSQWRCQDKRYSYIFVMFLKMKSAKALPLNEFYSQVHHKGATKVVSPQRIIKIHVTCAPCGDGEFGGSVSFVAGRLYDFVACWLISGRYKSGVAASSFCWSYHTSNLHNRPLSVNTGIGSVVQSITSLNGIIILPRVILRIAQTGTFWGTAFRTFCPAFQLCS